MRTLTTSLTIVSGLLISTPALSGSYDLGKIIVSGTDSRRITESVGTVDTITSEDIRDLGARNLSEAIKSLPGLYARTGGDGTPRIDIRGLRTRQVLLLLDGVPINSTNDGQFDPAALDAANIERIEVNRGSSSVLYGPSGSAGVINIVTKTGDVGTQGKFLAEVGDNDIAHGQLNLSGGDTGWKGFASASGYHQNDYELSNDYDPIPITGSPDNFQPEGDRINSDRSESSFYGNLLWNEKPGKEIGFSVSYREGEYGKPTEVRDTSGGDRDDFARRARFERVDDYEGLSFNLVGRFAAAGGRASIRPMLYVNTLDELTNGYDDATYSTQVASGAFRTDSTSNVVGGRFEFAYDLMQRGLSTIAADCHREDWDADGFELSGGGPTLNVIDIDEDVSICSLALEHEVELTDRLGLVGGIGYAKQTRDSGSDDSDSTYRVGLYYDLPTQTRLKASHAKKIRFPTLRDLFEPGRANPDLETETTDHYEVGLEQGFQSVPLNLDVSLFQIDAEDFIETDSFGVAQNFEAYRFQGVEVSGMWQATRHTSLRVALTYLDSENRSDGVNTSKLQNRPEHQLSVELKTRIPGTDVRINTSWLHIERSFELERGNNPTQAQETGDYDVVDLKIEKSFAGFSIFGRALNLFDDDYAESGGYPAPGRTLLIGTEVSFGS